MENSLIIENKRSFGGNNTTRIKDIKVGTKLVTSFMVVAFIVVIVGVIGIYNIRTIGSA